MRFIGWIVSLGALAVIAGLVWWPQRLEPPRSEPSTQPAASSRSGPRRIVALAPSSVEIIFALGAGDRVVGVGRFCDYPPEVVGLPQLGGLRDPDLERILALAPDLLQSMLEMRALFEVETARLAARRRTGKQLKELKNLVSREESAAPDDPIAQADLDFDFHHLVAMASGNVLYPLLLGSCKEVYTNLSGRFFTDPKNHAAVIDFHKDLAKAISDKAPGRAAEVMAAMLEHGRVELENMEF